MAAATEYKSVVRFGGVVDASWRRSSKTLQDALKGTEKEIDQMRHKQNALYRTMNEARLAGKDITMLQARYDSLTRSIGRAEKQTHALNRAARIRGRLGSFGRGVAGGARGIAQTAPGLVGMMGGGLAAGAGGLLALNAHTAEQVGLARSYGVSTPTMQTWNALGKKMGLSGENIGDMGEELANKAGEYKSLGSQSSYSDAFTMLGLTDQDLAGKTNEEQMALLMNRASHVEDDQVARSALDMLLGGEANKIHAYMRSTGKNYQEMMDAQKRYVLTTEEGTRGAEDGNLALMDLWAAVSTGSEEVLGVLMGEMAPKIRKGADDFAAWFRGGGKETMVDGIKGFARGLMDFWEQQLKPTLVAMWRGLGALAEWIGSHFGTKDERIGKATSRTQVENAVIDDYMEKVSRPGDSLWQQTRNRIKAGDLASQEGGKWQAEQDAQREWEENTVNARMILPLQQSLHNGSETSQTFHQNPTLILQMPPGSTGEEIGQRAGQAFLEVIKAGQQAGSEGGGLYDFAYVGG